MRIAHISDLHFGAATTQALNTLKSSLIAQNCNIIICSGDITQNGYEEEFIQAKNYFADFKCQKIFVPGNHDMPQWDIIKRLFSGFNLYKKYISEETEEFFVNDNLVIIGLNSARIILPHLNWANGGISKIQCNKILAARQKYPKHRIICVLHHPINNIPIAPIKYKTFGTRNALKAIDEAKIDIVMNGHLHMPFIEKIGETTFVTASTAASFRARGYDNGYMMYEINNNEIKISQIDL